MFNSYFVYMSGFELVMHWNKAWVGCIIIVMELGYMLVEFNLEMLNKFAKKTLQLLFFRINTTKLLLTPRKALTFWTSMVTLLMLGVKLKQNMHRNSGNWLSGIFIRKSKETILSGCNCSKWGCNVTCPNYFYLFTASHLGDNKHS